jgi:signal transduction histidine kinase/DNA-binding response OmpR family regulator
MPQRQAQKFLEKSVEAPVFVCLGAAIVVVLGTFFAGLAYSRQNSRNEDIEAISGIFRLLGDARARELKMETVWSDAFTNSRSGNTEWMHTYFGEYLTHLLEYDEIYVLDEKNVPVYAYRDGQDALPNSFDPTRRSISDLISTLRVRKGRAVRDDHTTTSTFDLGDGQIAEHRTISDIRRIAGRPALVILETIVPDAAQAGPRPARPFVLVAVDYMTPDQIGKLARHFGFQALHWIEDGRTSSDQLAINGMDGSRVGKLSWSKIDASAAFAQQLGIAIFVALALFTGIALLFIRRGRQGAEILKHSMQALASLNETLERRVAERTQELEVTLANIEQGVIMIRDDQELVVVNLRAEEMLEVRSPQEVIGCVKDLLARDEKTMAQSADGQIESDRSRSRRLVRPSGRILDWRCNKLPGGGSVITLSDITVPVGRQTQLEEAIKAANVAIATRSRFLSTMSHEMRTPLNGVIGALEILRRTGLSVEQSEAVEIATQSSEALLVHINDVLDFSKMEAGRLKLTSEAFDLRKLVSSVLDIVTPQAEARDNHLGSEMIGEVPAFVRGDAIRVRQVLLNLVSNGNKFTRQGSVKIRIMRAGGTEEAPTIEVQVIDSGIGISAERIGDLFQEFSMLDSTYTRNSGGTGLGLAISKRLIEAMGGTIGVFSKEGEGSTFWFTLTLPRASEGDVKLSKIAHLPVGPTEKRLILLVDDNVTNRLVGKRLLEAAGHRVDTATNGREAVEAARATRYDIIFMDISMPELDGLEATRQIRAMADPYGTVPIVALTANAIAGDRERFLTAGMNDYLTKPLRVASIEDVLKALPSRPSEERGASDVGAPADDAGLLDLQLLSDLSMATAPETVKLIAAEFVEEMHDRIAELVAARNAQNNSELQRISHSIAGASASAGAAKMHALARKVELLCVAGSIPDAVRESFSLERAVPETEKAFAAYLRNRHSASVSPSDVRAA